MEFDDDDKEDSKDYAIGNFGKSKKVQQQAQFEGDVYLKSKSDRLKKYWGVL